MFIAKALNNQDAEHGHASPHCTACSQLMLLASYLCQVCSRLHGSRIKHGSFQEHLMMLVLNPKGHHAGAMLCRAGLAASRTALRHCRALQQQLPSLLSVVIS